MALGIGSRGISNGLTDGIGVGRVGVPKQSFDPVDLFRTGRVGAVYDPSDLSTLFQDVAGNTPVTADGQQVQLMIDKSGNGNHASQLAGGIYHTDGTLHWITTDGTSNFYDIPYLGLYSAGAMTSVLGVSVLTQIGSQYLLTEGNSASDTPVYCLNREVDDVEHDSFIRNDANVVLLDSSGGSRLENMGAMVVSNIDTGSNVKMYQNSVLNTDDDYTRSGVLTLDRTTLFALGRIGQAGFARVNFYGGVIIADSTIETSRLILEQYMAKKSGVNL